MWSNGAGVKTYRVRSPGEPTVFVKLARTRPFPSFEDEAARIRWSAPHLPVPKVVSCGEDGEWSWLVTAALRGINAGEDEHTDSPEVTVPLLAGALRRFHEVPVAGCPFSFRLDEALAHATARIANGLVQPERDFHRLHANLSAQSALDKLVRERPTAEDLVVCHGDYCFSNILINDGEVAGFVDLGELGVADRWWDLAVASWSTTWDIGDGWERAFVEAYGFEWDQTRVDYFRLLYTVVS